MSIDKVVIQGAEFTRVADRYLLQTEVELALARSPHPAPHVERLTTLLEDIVSTADAVALEVVEAHVAASARTADTPTATSSRETDEPARALLREVREGLHDQIVLIDNFMHRLDG